MFLFLLAALVSSVSSHYDPIAHHLMRAQIHETFEPIVYSKEELPFFIQTYEPDKDCSVLPSRLADIFLPEFGASFFSAHQVLELVFHHSEFSDPAPETSDGDDDDVHTDVPPEFMICPEYLLDHQENDESFFNDFLPVGKLSSKLVDSEELQIYGYTEEHIFSHSKMKVCMMKHEVFYKPLTELYSRVVGPRNGRNARIDIDSYCDEELNQEKDISYLIVHQLVATQSSTQSYSIAEESNEHNHEHGHPVPPIMIRADGTINALSPHSNYFGSGVVLGPVNSDHSQFNIPVHEIDLVIMDNEGSRCLLIFHDGTVLELKFRVYHEDCEERKDRTIVEVKSVGRNWESDFHTHSNLPLLSIVGRHHNDSVTETSTIVIDGDLVLDLDDSATFSPNDGDDDNEDGRIAGRKFSFTRKSVTTFKPNSTVISLRRTSDEGHRKSIKFSESMVGLNLQFGACLALLIFSIMTCLCGGGLTALSLCCCFGYQKCYRRAKEMVTSLDDAIPNHIEQGLSGMEESCVRTFSTFVNLTWKKIIRYWLGVFVHYSKNLALAAACMYELFMVLVFNGPLIYSSYDLSKGYLLSCLWILTVVQSFDLVVIFGLDYVLSGANTIVKFSTSPRQSEIENESLEPLLFSTGDDCDDENSSNKKNKSKRKKKKRKGKLKKLWDACCCQMYVKHTQVVSTTIGVILVITTLFLILTELEEYWIFYHSEGEHYEISTEIKFLIAFNVVFVASKIFVETFVSFSAKCLMFSGIQKRCALSCLRCSLRCCFNCFCGKSTRKKKGDLKKSEDDNDFLLKDKKSKVFILDGEDEERMLQDEIDPLESSEEGEEEEARHDDRITFQISI